MRIYPFVFYFCQGDTLLAGSRDGIIRTFDLRSPEEDMKHQRLKQPSSICDMKLLNDEIYLVSSSMDGSVSIYINTLFSIELIDTIHIQQINLWDRRVSK